MSEPNPFHRTPEQLEAQKRRNLWLALALIAFVGLVLLTVVIKLADSDLGPGKGFYYNLSDDGGVPEEAVARPPGMTPDQAEPPAFIREEMERLEKAADAKREGDK